MPNIYHKDHGFVITADQNQINELLAKGGELVGKCSDLGKQPEIAHEPQKEEPKPVVDRRWKRK